jgi:hypothetical protein
MNKKKLFGYVLTGVLSTGIIGGLGTSVFAATTTTTSTTTTATKSTVETKATTHLDAATQAKVQKIKDDLKTQLATLGVTLPERGDKGGKDKFLSNLDEATKTKAQAILDNEKAGTITREEAKTQLNALGVTLPERGEKGRKDGFLANLDEATKAKAQAIFEKEKAGTITREEAKTQLSALGVTLPERGGIGGKDKFLTNLDEATKTKAQAILDKEKAGTITHDEAKTQLEALGVTLPTPGEKRGKADILANLDETTKAKAQELIDHAKTELEKLGVNHLHF